MYHIVQNYAFHPGSVVATHVKGVRHTGIASDKRTGIGEQYVIHRSKLRGTTVEEPLSAFSQGGRVWVHAPVHGYKFHHSEVVRRARTKLGSRWALLNQNCQHFTNWAASGNHTSEQLAGGLAAAGVAIAALCLARS